MSIHYEYKEIISVKNNSNNNNNYNNNNFQKGPRNALEI